MTRPTLDIISCIEAGLRGHKDDTAAGVARARISGILGSAKRPKRNTTKDEEGALTQLTKNEAIVVAEADQGNVKVVMDVVDYDKKAEEIINNYPFKAIARDPTRKVERGINKCVRQFFSGGKNQEAYE